MSHLQLALAALAVVALLVLFGAEKWQEHRRLRRIRSYLHAGVGDALAPGFDGGQAARAAAPVQGDSGRLSRIEPALGKPAPASAEVPTPVADADPSSRSPVTPEQPMPAVAAELDLPEPKGLRLPEPAEGGEVDSQNLPTPLALRDPGWVEDPLLDCALEIRCSRPVDGVRLIEASARLLGAGWQVPAHFVVWETQAQQWVTPDRFGYYTDALAAIQLANRSGCIAAADLARFIAVVQDLAHDLDADVDLPDVSALAEQARALDQLCVRFDLKIGLTVLIRAGIGTIVLRQAMQSCGLDPVAGQRWVLRRAAPSPDSPDQRVMFDLFSLDRVPETGDRLLLELDVAAVPESADPFTSLATVANQLAAALDGRVVDDRGHAIDDRSVLAVQTQLKRVYAEMREQGLVAGSLRARRLYL